jgi:hypothetical protein
MYNQYVTVERDVQSEPSNIASAGCVGEEVTPCSQGTTDSLCSEPLMRGDTPNKPKTIREFETALRGLGFSAREAKAIANRGFKATRDDLNELADKLTELAAIFKANE